MKSHNDLSDYGRQKVVNTWFYFLVPIKRSQSPENNWPYRTINHGSSREAHITISFTRLLKMFVYEPLSMLSGKPV
jgi:hypothetical protein